MNAKKSGFGRMKFSVSRLIRANGRKGLEMFGDAGMNYPLKDFRYEVQVGYRTITLTIAFLKESGKIMERNQDETLFGEMLCNL